MFANDKSLLVRLVERRKMEMVSVAEFASNKKETTGKHTTYLNLTV